MRNTALPKGNPSRIRASAPTARAGQAVGASDREICHMFKASALASPTRCYRATGKRCLLPVQHLFTPNQVPLPQFLGQHQANSTWRLTTPAEILQQSSSDELSHVLEQDLRLTPALAWLCCNNTRCSFSRSSGCPGPDISQCNAHITLLGSGLPKPSVAKAHWRKLILSSD